MTAVGGKVLRYGMVGVKVLCMFSEQGVTLCPAAVYTPLRGAGDSGHQVFVPHGTKSE